MSLHIPRPNKLQRAVQWLAAKPLSSKILARILPPLDRIFARGTKGRHTATGLLAGLPVIILTTIGAKSGLPRNTHLVAIPHNDNLIVIASNFGNKRHPSWYLNILSNPEVKVSMPGKSSSHYAAFPTQGEEYITRWEAALRIYPGFKGYKQRAAPREIPIVALKKI